MTIWCYSVVRNSEELMPFFLRHYSSFCERIFIWDDKSEDGTYQIAEEHPKVTIEPWPHSTGLDDMLFLEFAYQQYPKACGHADWVIWVDSDEFIYSKNLPYALEWIGKKGFNVVRPYAFNMVGPEFPKDDGRQIWEIWPWGVPAPVYSKPCIFKPCSKIRWSAGKHRLEKIHQKMAVGLGCKLLHYRYMGFDYTKQKNERNYARCPGDKAAAWTCGPGHKGEHSAEWAKALSDTRIDVVNAPQ